MRQFGGARFPASRDLELKHRTPGPSAREQARSTNRLRSKTPKPLPGYFSHCDFPIFRYIRGMNHLTKQEQLVLCIVLGLLLTGWGVKAYRTAHPAAAMESLDSSREGNSPTITGKQAER
jgi:hypothetical protein